MNAAIVALAIAGLATVAVAGIMTGLLREVPVVAGVELFFADPLEDWRLTLLRSLADLEAAHADGLLEEGEYVRLRSQTEARITRVLSALDRREGPEMVKRFLADDIVGGEAAPTERVAAQRRVPVCSAVACLILGTVLALVVSSLIFRNDPGLQASPGGALDNALNFFEERVEAQPDDLAARLDLAHRYLDAGMTVDSLAQYEAALKLNPGNAEANAHVGIILYLADRPKEALASVNRSLRVDAGYPEALFSRGLILLRGLHRPREAVSWHSSVI